MDEKINLDLKDRKILYELDLNARQSNSEIAKKVGLSKEVVGYRIKRMTESGLIKNFITLIDTTKLDFLLFRTFLKLRDLDPKIRKEILVYFEKNTSWYVEVKGNWDINFAKWTTSMYEFDEFWNDFMKRYGAHIEKKWVSTLTKMWHYRRAYILEKQNDTTSFDLWGENPVNVKIDAVDKAILKILATNARMSSVDISTRIKTSEKIVRDRIKKLVKNRVILGFRSFLDIDKLGYEYYKLHFYLKDLSMKEEMYSYAHNHPNIAYATEGIGCADFELDVQVKNNKELYRLIDDMTSKFRDAIRDYEFMQYVAEYKFVYLPEK